MKTETFSEKLIWLKRIKQMILIYKEELDDLEKQIKETSYDDFYYAYEIRNTKKELNDFKELYFRDLKNL